MALSREDVQEILRLLDDLHATELHLRTRHYTLSLRRKDGEWIESGPTTEEPAPQTAEPVEPDGDTHAVRAPLTGTFYHAPTPGAPPFVEVGTRVEPETVVGIVESMKLMNSIPAGVAGTVSEICAGNAELVEEGAVLIRIAPE
jgi:acetyl-CoA carboxylase biotin carboxyl carrier protein